MLKRCHTFSATRPADLTFTVRLYNDKKTSLNSYELKYENDIRFLVTLILLIAKCNSV